MVDSEFDETSISVLMPSISCDNYNWLITFANFPRNKKCLIRKYSFECIPNSRSCRSKLLAHTEKDPISQSRNRKTIAEPTPKLFTVEVCLRVRVEKSEMKNSRIEITRFSGVYIGQVHRFLDRLRGLQLPRPPPWPPSGTLQASEAPQPSEVRRYSGVLLIKYCRTLYKKVAGQLETERMIERERVDREREKWRERESRVRGAVRGRGSNKPQIPAL